MTGRPITEPLESIYTRTTPPLSPLPGLVQALSAHCGKEKEESPSALEVFEPASGRLHTNLFGQRCKTSAPAEWGIFRDTSAAHVGGICKL